jgi:MFS family permease
MRANNVKPTIDENPLRTMVTQRKIGGCQGTNSPQHGPKRGPEASVNQQPRSERLVTITAAVIGLCILGDSFLYGLLPLEARNLGIALPLVGILLSANRLVRLISNTWASAVFEGLGPRTPFIVAAALSLITTLLYGVGWGFVVFLFARLGWGVAWSALRQGGYQAVWTGAESARGRLTGLMWGIVRLGSAASVLMGGYLRDRFGYRAAILCVTAVTVLAIPVALSIRWPREAEFRLRPLPANGRGSSLAVWRAVLATGLSRQLLAAGFMDRVFEGIVISTTSLFLASRFGSSELLEGLGIRVGTIAGLLLALRWLSDLIFGPTIGALSDKLGRLRTLAVIVCGMLAAVVGVVNLAGLLLLLCLATMFVGSVGLNTTLNATANSTALQAERPHIFVGVYTTVADAGSALGPLLAYSLGVVLDLNVLYILTGSVLLVTVLVYTRLAASQ